MCILQLFGIDSEERQIYFRSGITSDEQTGKVWFPIDLPCKSCTVTLQHSDSLASSLCSSLSMDQLSTELLNSGKGDARNNYIGKSGSLQELNQNQVNKVDPIVDKDDTKNSRKNKDKFGFKSGFAVSFNPSSNIVNMDTEEDNEESEINTDELHEHLPSTSDRKPDKELSKRTDPYDSISEGLDSITLESPADMIKEDGTDILWTSVCTSACTISEESQIRAWLTTSRGYYSIILL